MDYEQYFFPFRRNTIIANTCDNGLKGHVTTGVDFKAGVPTR